MKRDMLQMKAGWLVERCGFLRRPLAFVLMPALAALTSCSPAMATDCDAFNISAHPSMKAGTPEHIISFELIRDLQLVFNGPFAAPEGAACDIHLKLSIDDGGNTTIELKSQSDDGGPEIEEVLRYSKYHNPTVTRDSIAALVGYSQRLRAFEQEGSTPNVTFIGALCDWARAPEASNRQSFLAELEQAALAGIIFGHPYDSYDQACGQADCNRILGYSERVHVRYSRAFTSSKQLVGAAGPRASRYLESKFGDVDSGTYRVAPQSYGLASRKVFVLRDSDKEIPNTIDGQLVALGDPFFQVFLTKLALSKNGEQVGELRFVRPKSGMISRDDFREIDQCSEVKPTFGWMMEEVEREQSE